MKPNDTSVAEATSTHLRIGPHDDLVESCVDAHYEAPDSEGEDGQASDIEESLDAYVAVAILGESVAERVKAAHKALKEANGTCGVANLILAREGSATPAEALEYAQKAVEQLKAECSDEDFELYQVDAEAYTQAIADLAQLNWNCGKKTEAVEIVTSFLHEYKEELPVEFKAIPRELAISFLLQMGEYKAAQAMLQDETENDEQWHYLNALIHFALTGDTLISRSALSRALMKGTLIAGGLTKDDENLHDTIAAFGLDRHIEDTAPAWHSVKGAIEWLNAFLEQPLARHNRKLEEIAKSAGDLQRWKRWEDALESAQHFNEKNNEKEAKNSLKAALREADRIDYSYFPFFETVSILMEFSGGEKKALADLQSQVKTRAQRFEADSKLGGPLNAMQLQACGTLFDFLQDYEASLALHQKATELVTNQVAQNEPNITLVDDVDVRNELAGTLLAMERFDEALPLYLTNADVLEQYLCANHVELLEMLEPAYRCLTSLGQEKEAEAMLERINAIDPTYLEALAATDHDCDDCGHEHH
ncbi:MAG: hypothetical protein Q8T09_17650 [Candidatus Melainabacteria bacterium]|nr:hypothetical protein [Candidatus Melainabacteria bacterium]